MLDGFIKVACGSINTVVADVDANTKSIKQKMEKANSLSVKLLVLPELCITGYTCGDLFFSKLLQKKALEALIKLKNSTKGTEMLTVVGLPLAFGTKLYNCAAVLQSGEILAIIPKTFIPNHNEFYEKRVFESANELDDNCFILVDGKQVPFGNNIRLCHDTLGCYSVGVEVCEDLWVANSPAEKLALSGATILANPSASNEVVGKAEYRKMLIQSNSARLIAGYIFACAGESESTQDTVFSNHQLIFENGKLLVENKPFGDTDLLITEIDVEALSSIRLERTTFVLMSQKAARVVYFSQSLEETALSRSINKMPFIPNENKLREYLKTAFDIQTYALKKRIEHINAKKLVIGISGGLDSTLALLVCAKTMKLLNRPASDILTITMPCFGTTDRTKSNALLLCELLGTTLKEINISKSVTQHFEDIGHDKTVLDVTFENSQARERTQVLMDIANKECGIVIGTGDLSELALGWATYGGDQMSMYGLNASIPKTLVRYMVDFEASNVVGKLGEILKDILDTPVSPELLPTDKNGQIKQKTEDLVGPYELHDFFLYHIVKSKFSARKILRLASICFEEAYDRETILKWLKVFVRRFFSQQFKRSCMPDGPKVTEISLSPRSDFRMPTDASSSMWLRELENL